MRKLTFAQATLEAMAEEMKKDDKVYVIGEDIARQGGVFGQFKGLSQEFPGRVIDSPISETFIIGGGVGAAMVGARPVVDMHFADFVGVCMDEILNQMAKARYMFGGQTKVPLVMRAPDGMTFGGAAQHSQSLEAFFIHIPGVVVVTPSNPYDAKMVLKAAIESDDPVLYFENKILYKEKGEMPELADEEPYTIGKAKVVRPGKDVTIVSYSIGMKAAKGAAELLAKDGIEAEVIDLITLSPWDRETVFESVKKTHRLCICHEAVKQGGVGAEIAAVAAEELLTELDSCIMRLSSLMTRINLCNSQTMIGGQTLTALIAKKDCLRLQLEAYRALAAEASDLAPRASRTEIKLYSTVDVKALQKQADAMAAELRQLDNQLQATNWTVDL